MTLAVVVASCRFGGFSVGEPRYNRWNSELFAEFSCVDSTGFGVLALLKYICCANMQETEFQISMAFDTITAGASSLL